MRSARAVRRWIRGRPRLESLLRRVGMGVNGELLGLDFFASILSAWIHTAITARVSLLPTSSIIDGRIAETGLSSGTRTTGNRCVLGVTPSRLPRNMAPSVIVERSRDRTRAFRLTDPSEVSIRKCSSDRMVPRGRGVCFLTDKSRRPSRSVEILARTGFTFFAFDGRSSLKVRLSRSKVLRFLLLVFYCIFFESLLDSVCL